jgi:enediyne biosynthesis protein E4
VSETSFCRRHSDWNFTYVLSRISWGLALAALMGCAAEKAPPPPQDGTVSFVDVHDQAGLDFTNVSGGPEQHYILEAISAGAAFFDYDGDGFQDLYVVDGTHYGDKPPTAGNRLYRNNGDATFNETTGPAGLKHSGWGMGCAVGDYDNDGNPDLYGTYWGPDRFYHNKGDGTFEERSDSLGLGQEGWGTSAAFGDLDNDGWLDLYVVNYLEFDLEAPPAGGGWCNFKGLKVFCGPEGIPAQADRLYRNDGGRIFVDMSAAIALDRGLPGLGVTFGDSDGDGDLDIYVANDSERNVLYRNDGDWHFSEVGIQNGLAYSENGRAQAGMGVDQGDYDNDGDLDIYVTNFSDDVNTLYRNDGGLFNDATYAAAMGSVIRPYLGWSAGFLDYDNDGWLDLFVANGHVYPQLKQYAAGLRYGQRNLLYHNTGGAFAEVGQESGPGWRQAQVSRAGAVADYDNDGDPDVLVINLNDRPALLRNDGGNRNNWLGLHLVGRQSNRDAIGATIRAYSGTATQMRQVQRARGFHSQFDPRVLLGLGGQSRVDSVAIDWPSGQHQVFYNPPLRRYLKIIEGEATPLASVAVPVPVDARVDAPSPLPEAATLLADSLLVAGALPYKGQELYDQGRYQEARAVLAQAIKNAPENLANYVNLGVVLYAGLGDYPQAARVLESARAQQPNYAPALHLLGKIRLRQNRLAEAIRHLAQATALQPGSSAYHNWLGLAYQRSDSLGQALEAFHQAARLAPWNPQPHLHMSRIHGRLGRPLEASQAQDTFDRLNPLHERIEHYTRKVSEYPQNARAQLLLGQAYMEQGRLERASTSFLGALRLDSLYAPAYHAQGRILVRRQNFERAILAFGRACQLDTSFTEAFNDLGQAYHQLGDLTRAVAAYRRAVASAPDMALPRMNLGMAYAMQGDLKAATKALEESIEKDRELVQAYDALAQVHVARGNKKKAADVWRRVLARQPGHVRAMEGLRRLQKTGASE